MSHHNACTASSNSVAPAYTTVPPMLAHGELLLSLECQQHPLGSIGDMQGALGPMASLHNIHQVFLRIHEDQLVWLDDFNFNFLQTCIDDRIQNVYGFVKGVQKHVHECVDLLNERITSMVWLSREREFMVCMGDEGCEEVFGESDEGESGLDMELESNSEGCSGPVPVSLGNSMGVGNL
ncbi:hypothetical protein BDN72DRAFT_865744 [Pluteus cervinus]|uniref:Uncharacterized protein n=1 Tax=Pluteus cervinus TaxID=181527 RepID=A0ACD3A025_9AGAR|nr:hypothetical protein BDN72DRAFT_865744 [Pluteus cervinus]